MATAAARAPDAPDIHPPAPPEESHVPGAPATGLGFQTVGAPKDLAKLFAKMSQVLGKIRRVPKNGKNTEQKYLYTTAADLLDEIRPLLAEHGIAFFPSVVSSTQERDEKDHRKFTTRIVLQTAFCCTETGAMLISTWHGEAADWGDKSYWKAYTGTLKYAHFQTWMVSTGDDPEEDEPRGERAQQEESREQESPSRERPPARGAQPAPEKPVRTEMHTRILATINERRKQLPDGYACTVGKTQTSDLKVFIVEHWELISGNITLAKKAASAVDTALKETAKRQRESEDAPRKAKEDAEDRLRGRYFALLNEKHGTIHDADRRAFQEKVTGKKSTADWTAKDFETAIKAVEAGKAADFICPM